MLDGLSAPEMTAPVFTPNRVESPKPAGNFTPFDINQYKKPDFMPLPRFEKSDVVPPPEYQEDPTVSMSAKDKALTDQLMEPIMKKPEPKKQQEAEHLQEVKEKQGFWAKILDWLRNLFRQ